MSLFNSILPSATTDRAATCGSGACDTSAVRPAYAVQETPDAFRLTVQLPGATKDGLEATAEGSESRVTGRRGWALPAGWAALHRETPSAPYELALPYENAIESDAI